MPTCHRLLLLSLFAPLTAHAAPPADDAGSVRIYRCVSTGGAVALQDSPCQSGHVQQISERQRPRDPPPTAAPASAATPDKTPPPVPVQTRTLVVAAPEPLYACLTPDGERYTADNGDGNPRWVSAVVPVWTALPGPRPRGAPAGRPPPPPGPPPVGPGRPPITTGAWTGVATGQWVRDTCQRLTQQEACGHLSSQRWDLINRYNSALQGERQQLVLDQRRLEERLERMQCRW